MIVWITRSQPGADRQAQVLRAHGHRALVAPVMAISRISAPVVSEAPKSSVLPAQSGAFTDILFLSEHAVEFGVEQLPDDVDYSCVRVFAVGSNTAARLAEAGLTALTPGIASSEGILAMPELADVSSRVVLIIAGEGGRDVLAAGLEARGARVHRLEVYRRQAIGATGVDISGVDAIAVGSGDGFEFTARLWFAAGGRSDVPVFVPSERVAAIGERLGFSMVYDCAGADADALLRGLTTFTTDG
jgi:uroporphyrinogen-III synthase